MFGNTSTQAPPQKKVANIDANQTSSNQQTVPVRYVLGRTRSALHQIAPVYNKRSQKVTATTGKDQTSTIGYIWFGDVAGILCVCGRRVPLSKLYKFIFNSAIVWENDAGLSIGAPYSPFTIAGYGAGRIYPGRADQPQDDLVLKPIGPPPDDPNFNPRITSTWPNGDDTKNHP